MSAAGIIKKSVLIMLPESDFNEVEFLSVKRLIEKSGFRIFIASDANALCTGNSGLKIKADISLYNVNVNNFSAVIIIGGDGIKKYWNNPNLHSILIKFNKAGKIIAAICNAPVILSKAGILTGAKAACYPESKIELQKNGTEFVDTAVEVSGSIITGRDPQSANEFTARIISMLL